ncbi:MAG TPA: protein kinase [Kofleriaceae bacterium]
MFAGNSRFKIVRQLGAGGMGVVYEVVDQHRKTRVALKALPGSNADLLYRLKREFRSLRDIVHHNLVRLDELFEDSGQWFFTMELIEGEDLGSYFRRTFQVSSESRARVHDTSLAMAPTNDQRGITFDSAALTAPWAPAELVGFEPRDRPIDFERVRSVFAQIAKGLVVLHDAGQVHRDIKPTNIMITRDDRVVILDFGLVTSGGDLARSSEGQIVGTLIYMAPEQAAARPVGPAADWYSFGVMLYEVLTGHRPFEGPPGVIIVSKQFDEPRPPQLVNPGCPLDLAELCVELLRTAPEGRTLGPEVLRRLGGGRFATDSEAHATLAPSRARSFVGRAAELRELQAAYDDVDRFITVTAFVHGESGIGKTTLIRHFVSEIESAHHDVVVMAGQCREHEAVPFKAVDGLIDALSRYICGLPDVTAAELVPQNSALLPTVFPVLGRIPAIAKAPRPIHVATDPFQQRKRVFAALRDMLCLLTERSRLVWFIDDMQWADSDSLRLLDELLRAPQQPRLLLLATVRSGDAVPTLPQVPGEIRRIRLQRLDVDEATALTGMLLDRFAPEQRPQAARIVGESAGHPLFIGELVRYAATDLGASIKQLHLDEAIWARVSQLTPECVTVLEILSVATAALSEEILQSASRLDTAELQRAIAMLRAEHLIRASVPAHAQLEVYHDKVRQSVLHHIDDAERIVLHERLAIALESSAGAFPPELVIHHLEGARQLDRAATKAQEAADRALATLAFSQAIDLYESALRLGDWSEAERHAIRFKLGGALASAGRGPEAAEAYRQAAEGADAVTQLSCRIQMADQLMQSGHLESGITLLFSLFREHGHEVPRSQPQIVRRILWARIRLAASRLRFRQRDRSAIEPRALAVLALYKAASRGLILVDTVRAAYFVISGLLLAMKIGDLEYFMYFLALEAGFRGSVGKDASSGFVTKADALIKAHQDPKLQPIAGLLVGGRAYLSVDGHYKAAFEMLERADEPLAQTSDAAWELHAGRFFQSYSLQKMGDFPRLRQYADRYLREAKQRGNLYNRTSISRICNILWLADDNPDGARAALKAEQWASHQHGYHLQHWLELNAYIEIAMYEGSLVDEAFVAAQLRRLKQSYLLKVLVTRCDTAWMLGRLALSQAGGPPQPKIVRRSIAILRSCQTRYASLLADMLSASLAIHDGDTARAIDGLRRAIAMGETIDILFLTAAARRRLGALLGGDDGGKLIAEAEHWMAAAGIKNFERLTNLVSPRRVTLAIGERAAPAADEPHPGFTGGGAAA